MTVKKSNTQFVRTLFTPTLTPQTLTPGPEMSKQEQQFKVHKDLEEKHQSPEAQPCGSGTT